MSSLTIDREGFLANAFQTVKGPCRVATTASITLSGAQTIDGVAVVADDRVLVKDQSNGLNAIYVCKTGDWELADDFDQRGHVVKGTRVFVTDGTTHGQTEWYVTTTGRPIPGRETISFAQFTDGNALAEHLADSADAHDASAISFSPAGSISATDVQAAIAELDSETTAALATKQPLDADLTAIAALTPSDGNIIVGDGGAWVAESGNTARTSLGLGTGNSPQFTGIELGDDDDTTITRAGAGDIAVEGNAVYRAGGTDVPVADGGSGRSSATAYAVICGGTDTTTPHQSIAGVGNSGQVLTSNGAGALPTFQAAPSGVVTIIAAGAISGGATEVDIALGTHGIVEIDLNNLEPSDDGVALVARFSQDNGSNYLAGASDYSWLVTRLSSAAVSGGTDVADTGITVVDTAGNAAGEQCTFKLYIYRPSASSWSKTIIWTGHHTTTGGLRHNVIGNGVLVANTDAITHVRFLWSAGTFDAGHYSARGYSFT